MENCLRKKIKCGWYLHYVVKGLVLLRRAPATEHAKIQKQSLRRRRAIQKKKVSAIRLILDGGWR